MREASRFVSMFDACHSIFFRTIVRIRAAFHSIVQNLGYRFQTVTPRSRNLQNVGIYVLCFQTADCGEFPKPAEPSKICNVNQNAAPYNGP